MLNSISYRILAIVFVSAAAMTIFIGNSSEGSVFEQKKTERSLITVREISSINDTALAAPFLPTALKIQTTTSGRAIEPRGLTASAIFTLPFINPPVVDGRMVLARDLEDPLAYLNIEANQRWPIASITKLMTAVVVREKFPEDTEVEISETAVATEGLAGGFVVGERYALVDLVRAMLVVSSNDAVTAIQEFYDEAHGLGALVRDMNSKANALAMSETKFADPIGLSILNQSTAIDLTKLVQHIVYTDPKIFDISSLPEVKLRELISRRTRTLKSINAFAGTKNFIGGKTGYTDEAGGNLVSIFKNGEQSLLIVVFGSEDRFSTTETLRDWILGNNY